MGVAEPSPGRLRGISKAFLQSKCECRLTVDQCARSSNCRFLLLDDSNLRLPPELLTLPASALHRNLTVLPDWGEGALHWCKHRLPNLSFPVKQKQKAKQASAG